MTDKVKKLDTETLTSFVHEVQKLCPNAVTNVGTKQLRIKVDDIDKESFIKLVEILNNKTQNDKKDNKEDKKKHEDDNEDDENEDDEEEKEYQP